MSGTTHFRQFLRHDGKKITLTSTFYEKEKLGTFEKNSIYTPIDASLREQLTKIEQFVCKEIRIPASVVQPTRTNAALYRPLWQGDTILISISNWCDYYQYDPVLDSYVNMNESTPLLGGKYSVTFEIPYVYIGPHKDDHLFSITMRIIRVIYEPPLPDLSELDAILSDKSTPPTPEPTQSLFLSLKKVERKRRVKKTDEPIPNKKNYNPVTV